jgi:hypothetical protein
VGYGEIEGRKVNVGINGCMEGERNGQEMKIVCRRERGRRGGMEGEKEAKIEKGQEVG